jgi:cytochrome b561
MNKKRYHPAVVILHWLTVFLLFASALLSKQKDMPGLPLNLHMILGAVLLIVMIARVLLRFTHSTPASKNKLAVSIELVLYLSTFFVLGMGAWIAYQRNLLRYLLDPNSAIGRGGFRQLGELHKTGWFILLGLATAHVGITIYEQFNQKADTHS